jgi:transcriptional regulator GlxA family with amidase domain
MKRRDFLVGAAAAGIGASAEVLWGFARNGNLQSGSKTVGTMSKLKVPASGRISVGFAVSEGVQVIDFAGPWEVFQDVMIKEGPHEKGMDHAMPFDLFTVAEKTEPIHATGGLKIIPDYKFADAPVPNVVVVPAQEGSPALHGWLKKMAANSKTDVVSSVCTGAFQLAAAGLLDGKPATTHHQALKGLREQYPDVKVQSGVRFVEDGKIATAGGLSSGIDMALHIVERYYGREVAQQTAEFMEYQSKGWIA